jgi:ABC-2 type transport system ATP-binding protein
MATASGDAVGHSSDLAISVVGLEKHYSGRKVVDGLTFTVRRGEIFGLLGPNGAGKTTTVEILEGYRSKDAGEVRVLGLDPVADGPALRARIGVMLQEGGLYPGLRPLEVLRLFASYYDAPEDPEVLLRRVGLDDARRTTVRRLSGGQAQRLSLACALIGRPDLVFLDEPTAGMDPHARATTWELVRELQARGTTVMLTTHLMDEAEALCDRVAIVTAGRLAAVGTPRELTSAPRAEAVTFTTGAPIDTDALARALGLAADRVQSARAGDYTVLAAGSPALVAALAAFLADHDITLGTLQANERSLEDVFLALTAEASAAEPAGSAS